MTTHQQSKPVTWPHTSRVNLSHDHIASCSHSTNCCQDKISHHLSLISSLHLLIQYLQCWPSDPLIRAHLTPHYSYANSQNILLELTSACTMTRSKMTSRTYVRMPVGLGHVVQSKPPTLVPFWMHSISFWLLCCIYSSNILFSRSSSSVRTFYRDIREHSTGTYDKGTLYRDIREHSTGT